MKERTWAEIPSPAPLLCAKADVGVLAFSQLAGRNGRVLIEAAGEGERATAALLGRQREGNPYGGYAIIAKCSASLQTELQARTYSSSSLSIFRVSSLSVFYFPLFWEELIGSIEFTGVTCT